MDNANEQAIKPLYETKSDLEIAMGLSKKLNELEPGSCTFPVSGDLVEWVEKEFNDDIRDCSVSRAGTNYEKMVELQRRNESVTVAWEDLNLEHHLVSMNFILKRRLNMDIIRLPVFIEEYKAPKEYPIRCIHHTGNSAFIANSNIRIG